MSSETGMVLMAEFKGGGHELAAMMLMIINFDNG